MSNSTTSKSLKPALSPRLAMGGVFLLWLVYTIIYTLNPGDTPSSFLEFIPGILAVISLVAAGFSVKECHLRPAPLSRTGLTFLAVSLLFMPLLWLTGRWTGWNPLAALVYAPASGISQELFFRAALLPVLLAVFRTRPSLAILIHALFFSAWHLPKAYMTAPLAGAIAVALVTFLCGLLWGKQVQHDRTVFWMMGYHSILLIINTFFTWG